MSPKLFWFGLFGFFFLIAAVLYSPSLSGPWQYDDYAQILDEKVLTGRSLPLLLSSTFRFSAHSDGWTGTRDLVRASFLANWQWWGKDPAGYRWVNLLIHVVNATLVSILIYNLYNRYKNYNYYIPALAGLIFLVHPLNSQAVAYVAQRFTSMATMFYLGAVVFYILYNRYNSYKYYIAAILAALLAFNSKEIAVTLPVALLLYNIYKGYNNYKYYLILLPFFLLSLKIPFQIISSSFGTTISMDKVAEVAVDSFALKQKAVDLTRHDYFLTQINVVGTYLRLAVLPVKQTLDYDYPLTKNFDPKTVVLAVLHLGLILVAGWLFLKPPKFLQILWQSQIPLRGTLKSSNLPNSSNSLRLVGLGLLWFYLTLLPESSVVPIADLIYEHRTYLPMVGLMIALAGAVGAIYNNYKLYNCYKSYIAGAVIVWLLLLSGATLSRAWVWGNEVRLWGDIYQKAPNKPRANKNYGVVLAAAGKYEEGVKRLARAVELEPENADYWSNFGTAYLRWGKYEEASGKFLKAYELFVLQHPSIPPDPSNPSNSLKDLRQAAQYMNDYGVAMVQSQHANEALAGFEKALKIDPTLYAAWLGLGAAYNLKGDSEMSIKIFSQVVKNYPDQPDAYNNLAIVLKKAGRTEEAAAVLARMPKKSP